MVRKPGQYREIATLRESEKERERGGGGGQVALLSLLKYSKCLTTGSPCQ